MYCLYVYVYRQVKYNSYERIHILIVYEYMFCILQMCSLCIYIDVRCLSKCIICICTYMFCLYISVCCINMFAYVRIYLCYLLLWFYIMYFVYVCYLYLYQYGYVIRLFYFPGQVFCINV